MLDKSIILLLLLLPIEHSYYSNVKDCHQRHVVLGRVPVNKVGTALFVDYKFVPSW